MPPERQPERKRPSHGWAVHERRRKAEERKSQPTQIVGQTERINKFATPSWEDMSGKFRFTMYNNPKLYTLYLKHRSVIREFYTAIYDMATGRGTEKRDEFIRDYTQKEDSEKYNPELIDKLAPHLSLVRDTLIKSTQRR